MNNAHPLPVFHLVLSETVIDGKPRIRADFYGHTLRSYDKWDTRTYASVESAVKYGQKNCNELAKFLGWKEGAEMRVSN